MYRELLQRLRPVLRRFFTTKLPSSAVEDAVQDTLICVHLKRHTYDASRPFEPWLMTIARYRWIERVRVSKRARFVELSDATSVFDHHDAVMSRRILHEMLSDLKPAQRHVIRLVRLEGQSIADAARATGQSSALVKTNIHRGLRQLATRAASFFATGAA